MVSVIIPIYNRADLIEETIKSVYNQEDYEGEIEIIVVNDGSTDDTLNVLEKINMYIPLKIIDSENKGVCSARNIGLSYAKGDFIQFLDSDDLIAKDKFKEQILLLNKNPNADFCYSKSVYFFNDPENIIKIFPLSDINHENVLPGFLISCLWPSHSPLYRKEACDKIGNWNTELKCLEDWEYGCRVGINNLKPIFSSKTLAYVREHDGERLSRGDLYKTAINIEKSTLYVINSLKISENNYYLEILLKHILSAARAFSSLNQKEDAKRCLDYIITHTTSKKKKAFMILYSLLSKLIGYKRFHSLTKVLLGQKDI